MTAAIDYTEPGPLTALGGVSPAALDGIPAGPVDVCRPVPSLVIQPADAQALGLPPERLSENQIRPAAALIGALLAQDPQPVIVPRDPGRRVVGTCRHFAVLSCALLRYRGIAARARCGFATYFQPGQGLDHWITEYWDGHDARWVRIDPEILGQSVLERPDDLRPGEFLSGGEAWAAFRRGRLDAAAFGVPGTDNWGPAEIRGNAVKDLAALNKVEMLPWDEWGRMTASYQGETGADYDELLDTIAAVCAGGDPAAVRDLYARDELQVPPGLIC
jgi:transglutaminase-like putative cysteine protease